MKPKTIAILVITVAFAALVVYALLREVKRDAEVLAESISGTVEVRSELFAQGVADIVKTDRLAILLVDPQTRQVVALKFETPLVPPQNIRIGRENAEGGQRLDGAYVMIGITDKDGEVFKVSPGEIYGRAADLVKLGDQHVRLLLDQPFRGSLENTPTTQIADAGKSAERPPGAPAAGASSGSAPSASRAGPLEASDEDPRRTIRGTIRVAAALAKNVAPEDRLVILLFDPAAGRPVATKIIPHTLLPQAFSISLPPGMPPNKGGYSLRIVTDKDNNPFNAAPGELVGRSPKPVPLGTQDLDFVLDQPYVR